MYGMMTFKLNLRTEAYFLLRPSREAFKTAKPDVWQTDFDLHGVKSVEVEKIQGILGSLGA
jgi:hypothetical protein